MKKKLDVNALLQPRVRPGDSPCRPRDLGLSEPPLLGELPLDRPAERQTMDESKEEVVEVSKLSPKSSQALRAKPPDFEPSSKVSA